MYDGYEEGKEGEFLSIEELPLVAQNNKLKAAIISIDQLKFLLAKIQKLEDKLTYYRQKALDRVNFSQAVREKSEAKKFISWKEEGFNSLDF